MEIDHLKAFEFALEWAKHLTTLSSGALVLSATFLKEIFKDRRLSWSGALFVAWAFLGASVVCGVLFIGALCAQINSTLPKDLDLYAQPGVALATLQNACFLIGIGLFAIFVAKNFDS